MSASGSVRTPIHPAAKDVGELLDPWAAADLIGADPDSVGVNRVQYEPGRFLVVEYDVAEAGRLRTAVVRSDTTLGAVPSVQWYPVDAALPALALPVEELEARLGLASGEPERLGYDPFVRATLRIGAHVVKLYASDATFAAAASALERLSGVIRCAGLERANPRLRATVQPFVAGTAPDAFAAAPAAGELLRRLQRLDAAALSACPDRQLDESGRAAGLIAAIAPDLADRADRLAARLQQFAPAYAQLVTSHGDFEPGKLIQQADGLVLVDVDELCAGAPADDLAQYAAHAARGSPEDAARVEAALAALLVGYGRRPTDLEGHLAASLLTRASLPFRAQLDDWRSRTERLLAAAESFV